MVWGGAASGQSVPLDQADWKLVAVDSVQPGSGAEKAFDGDPATYWHSRHGEVDRLPLAITIDLGRSTEINGFAYWPRPDGGNGTIGDYELLLSTDGQTWNTTISGTFTERLGRNEVLFEPVANVRYVKLVAKTAANRNPHWASVAELEVYEKSDRLPEIAITGSSRTVVAGGVVQFTDRTTVSPTAWKWTLPGALPATSDTRHPRVRYPEPGVYDVTLEATNRNGTAKATFQDRITVATAVDNHALRLDGHDNAVLIGMGILQPPWTLEMWIRPDDERWKPLEALIGGGLYTPREIVDPLPLAVRDGRLHVAGAKLSAREPLPADWVHVAATCDGTTTTLFQDGIAVARGRTAAAILPGVIGGHVDPATTFGGLVDEVRIWRAAVGGATLRAWAGRSLDRSHPHDAALVGSYPLDGLDDETSINHAGRGHQPYHVRNGRFAYKGDAPLALRVPADNPKFIPAAEQRLAGAVVVHGEWDATAGLKDVEVAKLRVAVHGRQRPLEVRRVALDLSGCSSLADIASVRLFATGQTARTREKQDLTGGGVKPAKTLVIDLPSGEAAQLAAGINYFLVSFDLTDQASPGNVLRADVPWFELARGDEPNRHEPLDSPVPIPMRVAAAGGPDTLRVLAWNIWHGGRHLGNEGPSRVLELIQKTNADVILMQEAYGSQAFLARSLGYRLHTPGPRDNLAIFSRLPLEPLPVRQSTFKSILAAVTMPNGRRVVVADWWLPFAYRPNYVSHAWMLPDQNPTRWIAEDRQLSTTDATLALDTDVGPAAGTPDAAVIIGGDFNSGSHLDWTAAAARFHGGYGPVALPTSHLMAKRGYADTFRQLHSDEVARPEGTYAVIFGHLQHSRIDYLYSRGRGLRAVASKIIRTSPDIDFVWPSDHAAVLTTFEVEP
jgi:PKD repeat protein